jgi:hypothetical protein
VNSGSIPESGTSTPSASDSIPFQGRRLTLTQPWFSLAEFVAGSAIVVGHNVYHVIPNEVPILFVIGLISLRVRDGGWEAMGLRWPDAWRQTVLIAFGAAAARLILGAVVIDPLAARFWPAPIAPSGIDAITGNVSVALRWLLVVWTFAAFGEEISYRGYLLTRGRRGCAFEDLILDRCPDGVRALRNRALLQGSSGNGGLRHGRLGSWNYLHAVWTQPVGVHSGSRVH